MRFDVSHDETHLLRVALWALRIKDASVSDLDAIAAALLHDVINMPKGEAGSHEASRLSVETARRFLEDGNFGGKIHIGKVAKAIEEHSFSRGANCTSDLSRALQDADRLDALGAIGIIRLFAVGFQIGAQPLHVRDPFAEERPLNDKLYSVDHCFTKLVRLPSKMNTSFAVDEAQRRMITIRAFLLALGSALGVSSNALLH